MSLSSIHLLMYLDPHGINPPFHPSCARSSLPSHPNHFSVWSSLPHGHASPASQERPSILLVLHASPTTSACPSTLPASCRRPNASSHAANSTCPCRRSTLHRAATPTHPPAPPLCFPVGAHYGCGATRGRRRCSHRYPSTHTDSGRRSSSKHRCALAAAMAFAPPHHGRLALPTRPLCLARRAIHLRHTQLVCPSRVPRPACSSARAALARTLRRLASPVCGQALGTPCASLGGAWPAASPRVAAARPALDVCGEGGRRQSMNEQTTRREVEDSE